MDLQFRHLVIVLADSSSLIHAVVVLRRASLSSRASLATSILSVDLAEQVVLVVVVVLALGEKAVGRNFAKTQLAWENTVD